MIQYFDSNHLTQLRIVNKFSPNCHTSKSINDLWMITNDFCGRTSAKHFILYHSSTRAHLNYFLFIAFFFFQFSILLNNVVHLRLSLPDKSDPLYYLLFLKHIQLLFPKSILIYTNGSKSKRVPPVSFVKTTFRPNFDPQLNLSLKEILIY